MDHFYEALTEGQASVGVLPMPKKELSSFRYYIEVTDKTLGTNRTSEYTAAVVDFLDG